MLYPVPHDDDPWGVFAPLRETWWGEQLPVVSGDVYSRALHGEAKALVAKLGIPPKHRAKRVPEALAWCSQMKPCGMSGPQCRPGTGSLPVCYFAPDTSDLVSNLAASIGLAWDEGRHVLIVEGEGFV